jgi:hypothetical protein
LGNHQPAPRERECGATRRLDPKAKPEGAESGETRKRTGRRIWMSNAEGKPEVSAPDAPKDARRGATRRSVAGTAGRCRKRGDSRNASAGAIGGAKLRGNS